LIGKGNTGVHVRRGEKENNGSSEDAKNTQGDGIKVGNPMKKSNNDGKDGKRKIKVGNNDKEIVRFFQIEGVF